MAGCSNSARSGVEAQDQCDARCDLQRPILTWQTSLDIQTIALSTHNTIKMQKIDLLYLFLLKNRAGCSNSARSSAEAQVQCDARCDLQRPILTWQTSLDIQTTALSTHNTIKMQKTDLLYLFLLKKYGLQLQIGSVRCRSPCTTLRVIPFQTGRASMFCARLWWQV